jgi:hypothetical protein
LKIEQNLYLVQIYLNCGWSGVGVLHFSSIRIKIYR